MASQHLRVAQDALRGARTIGDLPSAETCMIALKIATVHIAERVECSFHSAIKSGAPVYRAFNFTHRDAKAHKHANLLMLNGLDVPVSFCEGEVDQSQLQQFRYRSICN